MLYRKYRPKTFDEVISQNHIKITVQNQIKTNKLGHAYLFCGPRAVGKTTLARIIAKTINCKNRKNDIADACNKCSTCDEINKNAGLDIVEIDAASHTGVDNVRENIIAMSQVAPTHYKYKVFIIDEVHMLSTQAFNALLKTIEEPPNYIVFILCTTEIHKVPLTIISRCQRFDFKKIGVSDIVVKLEQIINKEKIKINKKVIESIALQSGGHMRDAESLLSQVIAIGEKNKEITMDEANLVIPRSDIAEVINLAKFIFEKNTTESIKLINKLVDEGIDLKLFSIELIEIMRKIMLAKTSQALAEKLGLELGENFEKQINQISEHASVNQIINIIEKIMKANLELDKYPLPQIALELAVIELDKVENNTQYMVHNIPNTNSQPAQNPPKPPTLSPQTVPQNVNTDIADNKQSDAPSIPQVQQPSPPTIEQSNDLTIDLINSKWPNFLASIQATNPSASFIMRACRPQKINGNQLTLSFKYKFHKEQIERPEIRSLLIENLNKIYGHAMEINAILNENLDVNGTSAAPAPGPTQPQPQTTPPPAPQPQNNSQPQPEQNSEIMNNIIDTFGGKVIN